MGLLVRAARESDLDRLVEIHRGAFPDRRGEEARLRNFRSNPLGSLGALRVVERDGIVVGHAFLFALHAFFGGARVPVGGIASLGIAAEARGEGVARALLQRLHDESRERGDVLSLLYAFRHAFYAGHGYAPVSPMRRIVASPESVPRAWRDSEVRVRAATGDDRAVLERLHSSMGARVTGWLERPSALWDALLSAERRAWFVAERSGAPVGYVAWTLEQSEAHGPVDLVVHELVAEDDEARRRLMGLIGSQRDQVRAFYMMLDAHDPIDRALCDADSFRFGDASIEHDLGDLVAGPMVRVHDVARAIEARPYRRTEEEVSLALRVVDGPRATRLAWRIVDGAALATEIEPEGPIDCEVDRATLGAVLYGALSLTDAVRLGVVRFGGRADASLAARADAAIALAPFFAVDAF